MSDWIISATAKIGILVFWGTIVLSMGSNIGLSILVIIYWKPSEQMVRHRREGKFPAQDCKLLSPMRVASGQDTIVEENTLVVRDQETVVWATILKRWVWTMPTGQLCLHFWDVFMKLFLKVPRIDSFLDGYFRSAQVEFRPIYTDLYAVIIINEKRNC